ncbi:class I SAM-dependent methyltransferase [Spirosoma areae]
MACPICESTVSPYGSAKLLGKYDVQYFRCSRCQFIFTETPYWLEEAYSSAITRLDIGLIVRNELMTPVVQAVINKWFNPDGRFIDYGGGYGMLVRMMRDRGFDFYRQDIYCANLYAELFDVTDVLQFKAELLTAFEVFEHLTDPVAELEKMLIYSDTILFSTMVQPTQEVSPESWWYFTPETGQHIALYSRASLQALADRFSLNYNWNEQNIHLFSRKSINNIAFKTITHPRWSRLYNKIAGKRRTLLEKDFSYIQSIIKESYLTK